MRQRQNNVDTETPHEDNPAFGIIAGARRVGEFNNHNRESVKSSDAITANAKCLLAIEDLTNLPADSIYQHASSTHQERLMSRRLPSQACPTSAAALAEPPCETCDTGHALASRDLVCRDFRDALGSFATGVTVLTAVDQDGQPMGVTISSFNSVSLDPPLIIWSLSAHSPRLEAFRRASFYAVNVLTASQQGISDCFAATDNSDRFEGVATSRGIGGIPLIEGCSAWFECANEVQYPGGDHLVFLGRVQRFARGEANEPLIFHGGCYRQLRATARESR
ncbi:MAG: p-hydroxyphenylacetate 3-hydroxylase, reductase component [Candidatus Accumulibacter regalis]|jgi:flavin reductase (DIM6/NTAB) family NADH-FMN oxidoreductase RutF|uniref:p-hydroxyphenylacetate 3-hydroxylase, reductase component n=1 Tax=Accumulibacter regalis TaxID=522306 RepID=A0A011QKC6_ACCRE|nr:MULTISPECIES: flavin reductase family protein [unclassified Candidatus Accumulibacter]EXI89445.1 MAG: p-hydroxyphenylacetate 3-hydroxylase, reductase component [Candidatus Accumulibacter regalis]HRE70925.1 flavin reductase family protein [Accumulibacter sp.]HRI91964.1 flavin reductase family protein [Accumulibacter sp.]